VSTGRAAGSSSPRVVSLSPGGVASAWRDGMIHARPDRRQIGKGLGYRKDFVGIFDGNNSGTFKGAQIHLGLSGKSSCVRAGGLQVSENCPNLSSWPVKKRKKYYYLRFTDKKIRIAKRSVYEQSDQFKERYRWRAGLEATMSEYNRRTGVKRLRVRGLKAVKFCAILKALAVNIFRAAAARAAKTIPVESLCEA